MNKKTLKLITTITAFVMGIAVLVMFFVNCAKLQGEAKEIATLNTVVTYEEYKGYNILFGASLEGREILVFSWGYLFAFLLPLIAIILIAVKFFIKKHEICFNCTAIILFIVSAILFFITTRLVNISEGTQTAMDIYVNVSKVMGIDLVYSTKISIGAILGGIFSIIGAIAVSLEIAIDKLVKE